MRLEKVISGGQIGVDIAALRAAKKLGIPTGGFMPRCFKTHDGCQPSYAEIYGMVALESTTYPPRTFANVKHSDATLRLAIDFSTAGENCTLRAIVKYRKLYLDINLNSPLRVADVQHWLLTNNVHVINVAGNAKRGLEKPAEAYLLQVFTIS